MYSTPRPFNNITNIVETIQRSAYQCPPGGDQANTEAILQQIAVLAYYASQAQAYGQPAYAEQDFSGAYSDPYSSYQQHAPAPSYTPAYHTGGSPTYHTGHEFAPCACIHCAAAQTPNSAPSPHASINAQSPTHEVQQAFSTPQRQINPKPFSTPHDDYAVISCTPSSTRSPLQTTIGVPPIDESTPTQNNRSAPRFTNTGNASSVRKEERPERRNRTGSKYQNTATEAPVYLVTVEGHGGKSFSVGSATPIALGEFVLFEGDRGTDIGKITTCKLNDGNSTSLPHVIRAAESSEVKEWSTAFVMDQNEAVETCNNMIRKLNLPLKVVNAVFQFDRKKLTFYYDADQRVDFRTLLHEMYQQYRCRIWMERASE